MKLVKKIMMVALFTIMGNTLHAQQQGQYSQYMMNYFLINPGVAGTEDYIDVRAGYRMQWVGLSGAPRNYYTSVHAPLNKRHSKVKGRAKEDPYHVLGGFFSGQKLGALSHNTAYATYAYHLPLSTGWIMSMGAIAGINQFAVNANGLDWGDDVIDPSVSGANKIKFDMGMGIWLYSKNIFMGISSMQILRGRVDFSTAVPGSGVLNRHYYLTGGYKIQVNQDIKVIPSLLFKTTATAYQIDVNTKVRYRDLLWAGMSYRKTDAVVFLAGAGIPLSKSSYGSGHKGNGHGNNARLEIGYSYDATMSRLNRYSGGSHEVMVGLVLPMGGRMICPSDYW